MTTETYKITISGMTVEVVPKSIKNLHLGVYPPHGRVRVAAPLSLTRDAIRLAVVEKLAWIKRHRAKFEAQPRQSYRELVSGETHYFLGRRYRLRVIEQVGTCKVILKNKTALHLYIPPISSRAVRQETLQSWYRNQLKELIPSLMAKWQMALGIKTAEFRIKRMKTKWGSCSRKYRRIWLNLELAKKPIPCLEFIVLHELVHLLVRHHNDNFIKLMDKHMPTWRASRDELNASHLGHEYWIY